MICTVVYTWSTRSHESWSQIRVCLTESQCASASNKKKGFGSVKNVSLMMLWVQFAAVFVRATAAHSPKAKRILDCHDVMNVSHKELFNDFRASSHSCAACGRQKHMKNFLRSKAMVDSMKISSVSPHDSRQVFGDNPTSTPYPEKERTKSKYHTRWREADIQSDPTTARTGSSWPPLDTLYQYHCGREDEAPRKHHWHTNTCNTKIRSTSYYEEDKGQHRCNQCCSSSQPLHSGQDLGYWDAMTTTPLTSSILDQCDLDLATNKYTVLWLIEISKWSPPCEKMRQQKTTTILHNIMSTRNTCADGLRLELRVVMFIG